MAIWMIRAGAHGEFESKFLQAGRVYVTWESLNIDLSIITDKEAFLQAISTIYPDTKPRALINFRAQLWPFVHEIKKGDLVVLPLKSQPAIAFGEITGEYHYEPNGPEPFYHWRSVKWLTDGVPRSHFGQDLLYSFGAFLTICRISRNNAEERIAAMRANGWKAETAAVQSTVTVPDVPESAGVDLDELARDQIARLIAARLKGHGLARLVDAILRAQGYVTYLSPEGADGGVDILAGTPPLGFGTPQLCVEVKSQDTPVDRPTVDKLLGAMNKFGVANGLFVSWSGFKSTVQKELAPSFFKVRLWTQKELLEALFTHYDQLDEDIRAELPLKRIWTVTISDA